MVSCFKKFVSLSFFTLTLSCGQDGVAPGLMSEEFYPYISAGLDSSCGITQEGSAWCWGRGNYGKLGNGASNDSGTPVAVSGNHLFKKIAVGGDSICAIEIEGDAYCWGSDGSGRLGDGAGNTDKDVPTIVAGGHKWIDISVGGDHACGVTTSGAAYCWGSDGLGELGNGATSGDQPSPTAVSGGLSFTTITAASDSTCALTTTGLAYCWGADFNGEIGNGGTGGDQISPVSVTGGRTYSMIDCGDDHCCALATSGDAYCWGRDNEGQVGNGATGGNQNDPVLVNGGLKFKFLRTGWNTTFGITTAGVSYSWGGDFAGRLGNGASGNTDAPSLITGNHDFRSIDGGNDHTCGTTQSGTGFCWGSDNNGRVGNGAPGGDRQDPDAVDSPF